MRNLSNNKKNKKTSNVLSFLITCLKSSFCRLRINDFHGKKNKTLLSCKYLQKQWQKSLNFTQNHRSIFFFQIEFYDLSKNLDLLFVIYQQPLTGSLPRRFLGSSFRELDDCWFGALLCCSHSFFHTKKPYVTSGHFDNHCPL